MTPQRLTTHQPHPAMAALADRASPPTPCACTVHCLPPEIRLAIFWFAFDDAVINMRDIHNWLSPTMQTRAFLNQPCEESPSSLPRSIVCCTEVYPQWQTAMLENATFTIELKETLFDPDAYALYLPKNREQWKHIRKISFGDLAGDCDPNDLRCPLVPGKLRAIESLLTTGVKACALQNLECIDFQVRGIDPKRGGWDLVRVAGQVRECEKLVDKILEDSKVLCSRNLKLTINDGVETWVDRCFVDNPMWRCDSHLLSMSGQYQDED
jgi:hypothetical protein